MLIAAYIRRLGDCILPKKIDPLQRVDYNSLVQAIASA
jgi:hypothetical protein